jgi:hypothetical protein
VKTITLIAMKSLIIFMEKCSACIESARSIRQLKDLGKPDLRLLIQAASQ